MTDTVHAGCVARMTSAGWAGVLIRGPSGIGKSDLALRLLGRGWRLVADDRVRLWVSDERLFARAAPNLDGLLEVRGLDVVPAAHRLLVEVRLIVDCLPAVTVLERVPEPRFTTLAGVTVGALSLRPHESSAAFKLEAALSRALERPPRF